MRATKSKVIIAVFATMFIAVAEHTYGESKRAQKQQREEEEVKPKPKKANEPIEEICTYVSGELACKSKKKK